MYRNNEVDPNVRATEQELFEGLEAKSVNCWPSVQFDIGARAFYDDKYWIGVSYRHQDAINPMIGVNFNEIRFGFLTIQYL